MACGSPPSRLARQIVPSPVVGPVQVAVVDRHPVRGVLPGNDGPGVGAVQIGPPDLPAPGAAGPVDVADGDRHSRRVVLSGDHRVHGGDTGGGPVDCPRPCVRPVDLTGLLGRPQLTAGAGECGSGLHAAGLAGRGLERRRHAGRTVGPKPYGDLAGLVGAQPGAAAGVAGHGEGFVASQGDSKPIGGLAAGVGQGEGLPDPLAHSDTAVVVGGRRETQHGRRRFRIGGRTPREQGDCCQERRPGGGEPPPKHHPVSSASARPDVLSHRASHRGAALARSPTDRYHPRRPAGARACQCTTAEKVKHSGSCRSFAALRHCRLSVTAYPADRFRGQFETNGSDDAAGRSRET